MATGGMDGFLRCPSINSFDSVVEWRPYHKNCRCALHGGSNKGGCSHGSGNCKSVVKYPIRRSWSEGSLLLAAAGATPPSPSPGSSPVAIPAPPPPPTTGKNRHRRFGSLTGAEE